MNFVRRIDWLGTWWYCSRVGRQFRSWRYDIKAYRAFLRWWHRTRWAKRSYESRRSHLFEAVISNHRVWLKIQVSCWSVRHAAMILESRFNGSNFILPNGFSPVTPFRLSERAEHIANWDDVLGQLPPHWDDDEYCIDGLPYAWCESLVDGCSCHGTKGRLDSFYCSDHGTRDESAKRKRRTRNIRHEHYVKDFERRIERRDRQQRKNQAPSRPPRPGPTDSGPVFVYPKVSAGREAPAGKAHGVPVPAAAVQTLRQLVANGYYCSIHKEHHPYGQQPIRNAIASLNSACEQASGMGEKARQSILAGLPGVTEHYLRLLQAEECAQRSLWDDAEIPAVLYKYIPRELIGQGAPNGLRATQLFALNDDMECNVTTMKDQEEDTLDLLRAAKEKLEKHLNVKVPWHELLSEAIRYGSPRLSPYFQRYLNPLVGVVSLTTDLCVPTMWAHYARNTGIVVGYDTQALRARGFELRPVVYSELAPVYRPLASDDIILDFVDQAEMDSLARAGRKLEGHHLLTSTKLAQLGTHWHSLARLLFVKGMSWEYEKEVRLLVDLKKTRDTGRKDPGGWPIRVIDIPSGAIKEINKGVNTAETDVVRAAKLAKGGDDCSGLSTGSMSAHAFRIHRMTLIRR